MHHVVRVVIMYGSYRFDYNEEKLNFNSYKRCADDNIFNPKFCVYHLGELEKESNNISLLTIQKMSFIIHFNRTHVKMKIFHIQIC